MTEDGKISQGTTQVGEVRRPLAAVSKITGAGNIAFFSKGSDWIIDSRDENVPKILELVKQSKLKTKVHEEKGTYRLRAWMIPEGAQNRKKVEDAAKGATGPFGRPGR